MPELTETKDELLPPGAVTSEPLRPPSITSPASSVEVEVIGKLADVQRGKIAATDKILTDVNATTDRMLPRIEAMASKVGVEADKLKPWDADQEAAKRRTDPITAFGSFGSVFGILASAFTRAPMENALNASAAAMGAIKANDDKSYDRAYKAWQDNTQQALTRHQMQHTAYQDAVSLLNVNMAAANTKLQLTAARFGDQQVLTLLESGMSKEVQEVLASRQRLALELQSQMPKIAYENMKMGDLLQDPRMKAAPGSPERGAAIREHGERWSGRHRSVDEQFSERWWRENPEGTTEGYTVAFGDFKKAQRPNTDAEIIETLRSDHAAKGLPPPTATEIAEAVAKSKRGGTGGGGATDLTLDRQIAAEAARLKKEYVAAGMPEGEAVKKSLEEASKLKRTAGAPSGNRVDDLNSRIDRIGYMDQTITKVEDLLKKHKALTGLGGTITRPAEVVTNWFGSNETDRAQFKRYISELQEWAPRILNDSSGRPLSAEAGKVSNIIAGLSPGDTTANTARAYLELRELLGQMKTNLVKRRDGGEPTSGAAPKIPEKAGSWRERAIPLP